ncbi:MAG: type 4a pilus biogenesis protein PilO, partial [Candidatus Omnitrophica bacterium]|nr:type 4a pilus biogenesis protein PilO [Candidatus Omnitrophota bacterium]
GWQYRLFSKYSETLTKKKQAMVNLERDINNLDRTKKEAGDLEKKIDDLCLFVIEGENISALIEDISKLANNSGVKITQIKPVMDNVNFETVDVKDIKFHEIEIQIVGQSGFHQLGDFISRVESAKNFFKVVSIGIDPNDKDYNVQNIKLSLRTYVSII